MLIIGVTGSIGMGKTTVAQQFAQQGAKHFDADACVHTLMQTQAVKAAIADLFPEAVGKDGVDRTQLGKTVFADEAKRSALESLLHPLVFWQEQAFIHTQKALGAKAVVLDVPLLFETGCDAVCDITVVATAPEFIQLRRVMQRKGMTEKNFSAIVSCQMPDEEKCALADYAVETGLGKHHSFRQTQHILRAHL